MNDNGSSPQSPLENSLGSQRNQEPNDLQVAITHMLKVVVNKAIENRRSINEMCAANRELRQKLDYDIVITCQTSRDNHKQPGLLFLMGPMLFQKMKPLLTG